MKHQLMQDLYACWANEGDNIIMHLKKIKQIWEHISVICQDKLPMRPDQLKEFMVHTLLMSWNTFATPYLKEAVLMEYSVHALIGDCNEEYKHQKRGEERQSNATMNIYSANTSISNNRPST
jgi:hypothetical protein